MGYYVQFRVGGLEVGLDPHGHQKGMTGPIGYWAVGDIKQSLAELVEAGVSHRHPAAVADARHRSVSRRVRRRP
jgi:hypothetical protein